MRRSIRHLAFVILVLRIVRGCFAESPDPRAESERAISTSPDGMFQLIRSRSEPGEHGEAMKAVEIRNKAGATLYRWTSPIGSAVPIWSPDSAFLAVNDSPGDRGDQLRVFRLDRSSVIPVREPDSAKLRSEAGKRHGNFLSRLRDVSMTGMEWKEGKLWCRVHGNLSPKRQPSLRVSFHDLWVYSFGGGNAVLEEVWSRGEPAEKVVRDPVFP